MLVVEESEPSQKGSSVLQQLAAQVHPFHVGNRKASVVLSAHLCLLGGAQQRELLMMQHQEAPRNRILDTMLGVGRLVNGYARKKCVQMCIKMLRRF